MRKREGFADEPTTFVPSDLSLYQQVAPVKIFEAQNKILYRFISFDLVFCCDDNQSYCLNSVNMIVPASSFPVSTKNLVKLFDMRFSWVFRKVFNTHKILRADIECMPVPVEILEPIKKRFLITKLLEYYGIEGDGNGASRVKR